MVERPVFTVWGFVGGVILIAFCLAVIFTAILLLEAPASDASLPPAASNLPASSDIEAIAAGNRDSRS